MKPNIGITAADRQEVANRLTKLLADEFVLYTKTRNAHWNIEGPDFHTVHIFFESQYQQLEEIVDNVAERIRSIGHYATGTLKGFLENTHLTEANRIKNNSSSFINELLGDHDTIVEYIRGNIDPIANEFHDYGSSDFITGLIEVHEKLAWMLRSHLK
jgi:starvation-inducible DNA-binding protein